MNCKECGKDVENGVEYCLDCEGTMQFNNQFIIEEKGIDEPKEEIQKYNHNYSFIWILPSYLRI